MEHSATHRCQGLAATWGWLVVDEEFMRLALAEAAGAAGRGEVPVGAVLVDEAGQVVAQAGNRCIADNDPAGHAEMVVLRAAGQRLANYRLTGTTLYVTLEPCLMCMGAMIHARVGRLVFGALDPKTGAVVSRYQIGNDGLLNHRIEVVAGVLADESSELLRAFFKSRRQVGAAGKKNGEVPKWL